MHVYDHKRALGDALSRNRGCQDEQISELNHERKRLPVMTGRVNEHLDATQIDLMRPAHRVGEFAAMHHARGSASALGSPGAATDGGTVLASVGHAEKPRKGGVVIFIRGV